MPTATLTSTELAVERRAGRTAITTLRSAAPLGLVPLGGARVAIVQTAACLVGDDDVRLHVRVGAGAALELVEISATVAHPGADARQSVHVEVAAGGRLVFAERPLIVAAGARVRRSVEIELAHGARALHREALVLGRHGEEPGSVRARVRIAREGVPVLDETIDTGDLAVLRSPAVLGEARAVAGLGLYGAEPPAPEPGAFALGPADTLVRRIGGEIDGLDDLHNAWRAAVLRHPIVSSWER
jgi:urease accessory protein